MQYMLQMIVVLTSWSLSRGSSEVGLQTSDVVLAEEADLDSGVLTFATVPMEPFFFPANSFPELRFRGFLVDLVEELCGLGAGGNHSCRLRPAKDGRFGRPHQPDGHFDGLVGEVVRGEVAGALGPLTMTPERRRLLDFSLPFLSDGVSGLLRPSPLRDDQWRLEDVLEDSELTVGVIGGGLTHSLVLSSELPLLRRVRARLLERGRLFSSHTEALAALRSPNFTSVLAFAGPHLIQNVESAVKGGPLLFVGEDWFNRAAEGRGPCDLRRLGPRLNTLHFGVALPKASPLKRPIDDAIARLASEGRSTVRSHLREELCQGRWFEAGGAEAALVGPEVRLPTPVQTKAQASGSSSETAL